MNPPPLRTLSLLQCQVGIPMPLAAFFAARRKLVRLSFDMGMYKKIGGNPEIDSRKSRIPLVESSDPNKVPLISACAP